MILTGRENKFLHKGGRTYIVNPKPAAAVVNFYNPINTENTSILIVGNSPSVLDHKLGHIVDTNFDVVVRLNNFETEGYEAFVGERTDIWFNGASRTATRKHDPSHIYKTVVGLSDQRSMQLSSASGCTELTNSLKHNINVNFEDVKFVSPTIMSQLKRDTGLENPSIGFLSIYCYVEYYAFESVTIYGFDFFQKQWHYYDDDEKPTIPISTAHRWDREREIVQEWIDSKKIKVLDDSFTATSRKIRNIFVLGNAPEISEIDFEALRKLKETREFLTVGVNRIYKVYQPDILFFMDIQILKEMMAEDIVRDKSSRWLFPCSLRDAEGYSENKKEYDAFIASQEMEEIDFNFHAATRKKSSLLWVLYHLKEFEFLHSKCNFYLLGVSLKASETSHYFDGSYNPQFSMDELQVQYNSQLQGIKWFHDNHNFSIFSMTANSKLNSFLPFIRIPLLPFIESSVPENNDKNTVLVSMLTKEFLIAYGPFVRSLLEFNPWFDLPILLLCFGLTDEDRKHCLSIYPKTIFREIRRDKYTKINFDSTTEKLRNTYYKLDMFSLYEYDRAVFIDLDVIFQGDISEIFKCNADIAMIQGYHAGIDQIGPDYNSGVIIINKKLIVEPVYDGIIRYSEKGFGLPDQVAINEYFKGEIHTLPKMYNCEKRVLKSKAYPELMAQARIIHYVSQKPWDRSKTPVNQGFESLEKIWWLFMESDDGTN